MLGFSYVYFSCRLYVDGPFGTASEVRSGMVLITILWLDMYFAWHATTHPHNPSGIHGWLLQMPGACTATVSLRGVHPLNYTELHMH